jgi:NhaA family Na+:H+ antiporter
MARSALTRVPLFRVVARPVLAFFRLEASGGILLALATLVALVWANSPWAHGYEALFGTRLTLGAGGSEVHFSLHALINDGLMAVFFFAVGMEIQRELVVGELRRWRQAVLPLVAAAGGMALPALLYLAFTRGTPGAAGWGIPVATDIAFAIGCLTLLKKRVAHGLVVFLTALAIFDDIGGIIVIALFYGTGVHLSWLLGAGVLTAALMGAGRLHVRAMGFYAVGGALLWYLMHHGGIHATIAGVVLGLCVPARALRPPAEVITELHDFTGQLVASCRQSPEDVNNEQLLQIEERIEDLEPPLNRFLHLLHPWVAYVIVPLFALANAGVSLKGVGLSSLLAPVPLGIIVGLVVGKGVGIFAASMLAVKTGLAELPAGARTAQVFGVAVVGGIGFTVSLFIAQLAFPAAPDLLAQAKLGVLVGSGVSAVLGTGLLRLLPPSRTQPSR